MSETASTNSERLNLRLKPAGRRRIEQAAAFEGRTVSSFIVWSALASAEWTIREHDTMVLSPRDVEDLLQAILQAPAAERQTGRSDRRAFPPGGLALTPAQCAWSSSRSAGGMTGRLSAG